MNSQVNRQECRVAVFGSADIPAGSEEFEEIKAAGRLLAEAGFVVLNGGYTGAMEAV